MTTTKVGASKSEGVGANNQPLRTDNLPEDGALVGCFVRPSKGWGEAAGGAGSDLSLSADGRLAPLMSPSHPKVQTAPGLLSRVESWRGHVVVWRGGRRGCQSCRAKPSRHNVSLFERRL